MGQHDIGRLLVIGESLVDVLPGTHGPRRHAGGSPANVALGLARLGLPATLLTHVARDADGRLATARLERAGVQIHPASHAARRTPTAVVGLGADGEARYDFDVSWDLPATAALPAATSWLHLGSYAAVLPPGAGVVAELARAARARGIPVSLDPNIRPALLAEAQAARERYLRLAELADVLKLSDEDSRWLCPGLEEDAMVGQLLGCGPRLVVLTRGADGARLVSRIADVRVPAALVDAVVDTIGAGDGFMAALIHQLHTQPQRRLDGPWLTRLGEFAAAAAGLAVQRAGAEPATRGELAAAGRLED